MRRTDSLCYWLVNRLCKPGACGLSNEANRETWVAEKLAALAPGSRLLDAGAGECRYRPHCSHLKYVSQDFCQYDGVGDGSGLQTREWNTADIDVVCDITKIPEPDGSFDAVLCTEVLEHVPDPSSAIRELSRLLKASGTLILTVPFASLTHFAPYHFQTGFSRFAVQNWLDDHGLEAVEISTNGNYFEFLAQEVRRLDSFAEQYCRDLPKRSFWRRFLHLLAKRALIRDLGECSARDQGSDEAMCFGIMALARKVGSV